MLKHVHFRGIMSGDYECFVWAVTKEIYIALINREPDEEFDRNDFHPHLYNVYPSDIFKSIPDDIERGFIITVEE